jgi:predicted nucleotidyltransferase
MSISEKLELRRQEVLRVAARHGAGNVAVFGSVARGEETPESDIDLLIDVTGKTTPWFPGGLTADLEELLGCRVQVVLRRSLSPLIRDSVLKDARAL